MNRKLYVLLAFILAGVTIICFSAFKSKAPQNEVQTVLVKVKLTGNPLGPASYIKIYYPDREMEKIELKKSISGKGEDENNTTIITTFNKLNNEGYRVVSSTENLVENYLVSTFVFTKNEE
jgi:hypothetical protein